MHYFDPFFNEIRLNSNRKTLKPSTQVLSSSAIDSIFLFQIL